MATPKYQGIKLGPGGLEIKAGECEIFSKTVPPVDGIPGVGDGKDGDIWIQVSGGTSTIYQKANNAWTNITPSLSSFTIINDSAVADLAISYTSAAYPTAIIDYYIQSASGDYERGTFNIVNDGVNAFGSQYNVNATPTPLGVDFSFVVNGADIEVRYDSSATPIGRVIYYSIRR